MVPIRTPFKLKWHPQRETAISIRGCHRPWQRSSRLSRLTVWRRALLSDNRSGQESDLFHRASSSTRPGISPGTILQFPATTAVLIQLDSDFCCGTFRLSRPCQLPARHSLCNRPVRRYRMSIVRRQRSCIRATSAGVRLLNAGGGNRSVEPGRSALRTRYPKVLRRCRSCIRAFPAATTFAPLGGPNSCLTDPM